MKLMRLCVVAIFVLVNAGYSAETPATAPAANYTAEQKTALNVLDSLLQRFESLLNQDDNTQHKDATAATLTAFKQRRAALSQSYDQGRYDELKTETMLEYQRLAHWMTPPTQPPTAKPSMLPANVKN